MTKQRKCDAIILSTWIIVITIMAVNKYVFGVQTVTTLITLTEGILRSVFDKGYEDQQL